MMAAGSTDVPATPAATRPSEPGSRQRLRTTPKLCRRRGAIVTWNVSAAAFTIVLKRAKKGPRSAFDTSRETMLLKMKSIPIADHGADDREQENAPQIGVTPDGAQPRAFVVGRRWRDRAAPRRRSRAPTKTGHARREREYRRGQRQQRLRPLERQSHPREERSHGGAEHPAGGHDRIRALRLRHIHRARQLDPELRHQDGREQAGPDVESHQGCRRLHRRRLARSSRFRQRRSRGFPRARGGATVP